MLIQSECDNGTIVYIFQIVFCVCCMYSTWHTVMDTRTYYFILFGFIILSMFQELNKVIQNKLCIELNLQTCCYGILLMGINQTVKLRFQMYALYVFSLVVR